MRRTGIKDYIGGGAPGDKRDRLVGNLIAGVLAVVFVSLLAFWGLWLQHG